MASTYTELKKGATGNNVSAMQTALANAGYSVNASGSFDDATEAALRNYQQANGLTVDGIAGDQTLSKLYGTGNQTDTTGYTPSAAVTQAQKYLESVQANKPGSYQSKYTDQMDDLLNQITTRGPFSYDPTNDPLYNIYKDRYQVEGRRAMQDTMGQAAALTGGYGNSYAQIAGQQQYNQYIERMNDVVPELQQQAYQRYNDEGDRLAQNYALLGDAEDRDYGRYNDEYNRWLTGERNAQGDYLDLYDRDYNVFAGDRQQANVDRDYANTLALSILQTGQMPSADLLRQAGISPEDAQLLLNYYTPKPSGGNGGKKGEQPTTDAQKWLNTYNSTGATMARNNLKQLDATGGKTADVLTPRQWAGEDPVSLGGTLQTYTVNPLQQATINQAKQSGMVTTLPNTMQNYVDYAEQAIENAYNSGRITGKQAADLAKKVQAQLTPTTNTKKTK